MLSLDDELEALVARLELLDELQMQASIAFSKLAELQALPTLFFELHGSPGSVTDQREQLEDLVAAFGGGAPRWAEKTEDRSKLWSARHNAYWAARALQPGFDVITTDACVPISQLPRIIAECKLDAAESGFACPVVGHVGDGNFHMVILHQPSDRISAEALATRIARRAIALGGTATGEHGIGLHRTALLIEEHGEAVEVMRAVKRALDPLGLMNPGKLLSVS